MTQETVKLIEDYLLAGFCSMEEIARRTGVTVSDVDAVMMAMDVPQEDSE